MSKLNPKGTQRVIKKNDTKHDQTMGYSKEGNLQYVKEPLQHLYELVVSTLVGKDTFYRSNSELIETMIKEIQTAVDMGAYDFIANLAIHARTQMYVRSMPIVLVVHFAKALAHKRQNAQNVEKFNYPHMRQLVCDVIQRVDQITDMYAYALEVFGSKNQIPMAIKRGVADAFNKFNEYHFAKYDRGGSVKFRDVLRIVHPKAKNEKQGFIFEKIIKEALEVPYTWEVELSRNGQLPEHERKSNKQIWTELLTSGKLGYMALLRNLRNIVSAGVDDDILKTYVADVISDPVRVAESKQFPHAYVLAHKAATSVNAPRGLLNAIEKALELSCKNIPQLGEKVALFVDSSGSMQSSGYNFSYKHSNETPLAPADHASVLAAALAKANSKAWDLRIYYFDSHARRIDVDVTKSVLSLAKMLRNLSQGGATRLNEAFKLMDKEGYKPDTLVVLSDMEVHNCGQYERYDYIFKNDNCIKIAINLNGSSTTPLSEKDGWYQMAGWSDKMFLFIPAIREKKSIVNMLNVPYIGVEAMKMALKESETTDE